MCFCHQTLCTANEYGRIACEYFFLPIITVTCSVVDSSFDLVMSIIVPVYKTIVPLMISLWVKQTLVGESFNIFSLLGITLVVLIVSVVTIVSIMCLSKRLVVVVVMVEGVG